MVAASGITGKRAEIRGRGRHYFIPELSPTDPVPSVTNILGATPKPALVNWAANTERELVVEAAANLYMDLPSSSEKMARTAYITTLTQRLGKEKAHQKELRKAGNIGSETHALIEWHLRKELLQKVGPEPMVSEKALWAFMAWQDWRDKTNLVPLHIEQMVWSSKLMCAGTADLLAELDHDGKRRVGVLDWKTGKGIYPEHLIQVSVYRECLIEMGHADHSTIAVVVRLPKVDTDPEFETRELEPSETGQHVDVFRSIQRVWAYFKDAEDASRKKWVEKKRAEVAVS